MPTLAKSPNNKKPNNTKEVKVEELAKQEKPLRPNGRNNGS